jgi:hypothetical protein
MWFMLWCAGCRTPKMVNLVTVLKTVARRYVKDGKSKGKCRGKVVPLL